LTELLGTLGVVPDVGILELSQDLFEFFAFGVVVKGTP
jgi:hypothetical protein